MCPEGGATYAAYKAALADGRVKKTERAVLFNCATGLKYPMPKVTATLDRNKPIDFAAALTMAKRKSIEIEGFAHKNPIPAACRLGNMLMTGIITGTDPATGKLADDAGSSSAPTSFITCARS